MSFVVFCLNVDCVRVTGGHWHSIRLDRAFSIVLFIFMVSLEQLNILGRGGGGVYLHVIRINMQIYRAFLPSILKRYVNFDAARM